MLVLAPPSQDNRSAFWVRTSLTLSNRYFLSLPSWEKKISTWKSAQKFDFLLFMYMVLSHSFLNEIWSSVVISPYRKLSRMPQLPSRKPPRNMLETWGFSVVSGNPLFNDLVFSISFLPCWNISVEFPYFMYRSDICITCIKLPNLHHTQVVHVLIYTFMWNLNYQNVINHVFLHLSSRYAIDAVGTIYTYHFKLVL